MAKSKYLVFDTTKNTPYENGLQIHIEATFQIMLASGFPDDEITAQASFELGKKSWEKMYTERQAKGLSKEIQGLLNASTKKEAERICKNSEITHEEFSDFIILSESLRFKHSLTKIEIIPSDLVGKKLPKLVHLKKDKSIHYEGQTELTEGQLRHLIQNRKNMHVHIFDGPEGTWHCFYFSFSDLRGNHWHSQHLHYLSNLWTFPRKDLLVNFSQDRHKQIGEHIKYSLLEEARDLIVPILQADEE